MANIKSAKKRILQSNKKRLLNKSVKSELKTEIKKLLQLLHDPKSAGTEAQLLQLRKVEKHVDKAAGKKVVHKNKAARIKSRLRIQYNALNTSAQPSVPQTVAKATEEAPQSTEEVVQEEASPETASATATN